MRQKFEIESKMAEIPAIGLASPRQEQIRSALQDSLDIRDQIDVAIQDAINQIVPGDVTTVVRYDSLVWADGTASSLEVADPEEEPALVVKKGARK